MNHALSVLLIHDGSNWTAQCLQYDIAAQGESIKEAKKAFEYALAVEIGYLSKTQKTLDDLPSAPKWYWGSYEQAAKLEAMAESPLRLPTEIAKLAHALIPRQRELRVA